MKVKNFSVKARAVSLILIFLVLSQSAPPVLACGPSFLEPVFVFKRRPDFPRRNFLAGNLGVVDPEYTRSNLFIAYRYLNDLPLTAAEREQTEKFWGKEGAADPETPDAMQEAVKKWVETRAKVTSELPPGYANIDRKGYEFAFYLSLEKKYKGFVSYVNCAQNALEVAAETLQKRIAAHGAQDELVRQWLAGQDAVFSNCSQIKTIPQDVSEAAPVWLKNDRQYQIAAANFYVENYEEARERFARIAGDENSEWQKLSDYLVGRTLIRQASFAKTETETKDYLQKAEAHLAAVAARNTEYRRAAQKLLNLAKIRLRPEDRTRELSRSMLRTNPNNDLGQDLTDYVYLLDRYETQALAKLEESLKPKDRPAAENNANTLANTTVTTSNTSSVIANSAPVPNMDDEYPRYDGELELRQENIPASLLEEDLSDWIFNYQLIDPKALEHAAERWRKTGKEHWLMSALAKLDSKNPQVESLTAAAQRVSRLSKAFPTVAFHTIRILTEQGRSAEARRELDAILSDSTLNLPASARNLFLQQRTMLAESLDEFLRFAPRRPLAFTWDGGRSFEDFSRKPEGEDYLSDERAWKDRVMFDEDGRQILEKQLPLALLVEAVKSPRLPDYLKRQLLIAGWTRAVLLENDSVGRELASLLARHAPEMSEALNAYSAAPNYKARRNAALYAILKFPALDPYFRSGMGRLTAAAKIDSYRDNWWCAPGEQKIYRENAGEPARLARLNFLTDAQRAESETEQSRLAAVGYAPNYLAARAVEWAKSTPGDSRLPEALHLAVRATRYGCNGENIGVVSKAAYDLLKTRYPNSAWARRTPYWYKQ